MKPINLRWIMEHFDMQSVMGWATSFCFTMLGVFTMNAAALLVGILVGISTIALNIVKFRNEMKKSRDMKNGTHFNEPVNED